MKELLFMSKFVAEGEFEVTITPQADDNFQVGRMTIDKVFSGDLRATSQGQMLSHRTSVEGSAGYVAIEHVSGTLDGKKGNFTLQHSSTMQRGEQKQNVFVIPDSATDELVGLAGKMLIIIKDGLHFYEFNYSFDDE